MKALLIFFIIGSLHVFGQISINGVDQGNPTNIIDFQIFAVKHDFRVRGEPDLNPDFIRQYTEEGILNVIVERKGTSLVKEEWLRGRSENFKKIQRGGHDGFVLKQDGNNIIEEYWIGPGVLIVLEGEGKEIVDRFCEILLEVNSEKTDSHSVNP